MMSDATNITVIESRQKRDELAKTIADLLVTFSRETGVLVTSIEVDCSMNYGGNVASYYVDVEVKLP